MRILLVATHHPVGHSRYMLDAFKRLGADVRSIGQSTGTDIWNLKLPPHRQWNPDGPYDAFWPDWTPDLVIVMEGSFQYHHPRYANVPHVVYTVDNHVLNFEQPGIAHYFLAHGHGQAMPITGPDRTWLPCAYDPVFFTPSPIPWAQRRFDVSMVGVMYPNRVELINAIKGLGVQVCAGTGAVYEEFRDIYHNTRISLCLSIRNDVAQRIFETAAMGCLVLSDWCPDLVDLKAEGIVTYASLGAAVQAVRQLLTSPGLSESLVAKSLAWSKPHTWDARAQAIMDWATARTPSL